MASAASSRPVDRPGPSCGRGWYKAQASGTSNCVEVASDRERILVRDSKNPDGPVLVFTFAEWDAFVSGVRAGEFDRSTITARASAWLRSHASGRRAAMTA